MSKKVYLTPGAEYLDTLFEANFLTSGTGTGEGYDIRPFGSPYYDGDE